MGTPARHPAPTRTLVEGSLVTLFAKPSPEYFCKLLGHNFIRWALPLPQMPRVHGFPQVGFCIRCQHPLLRPKTSEPQGR